MFKNKRPRNFNLPGESDSQTDQTWEITPNGDVFVDVGVLLQQPKVKRQIAKAHEIMERIRNNPQDSSQ
ncbi:MAG: hypothetical protein OXU94_10100 [Gammaproteobacteria bacterium]|nr:hypothetical protein [Gammaproteobacteria bacterium]